MENPRTGQPLRVVQWTTGNVGKQSLHAIVGRPDLELVGLFTLSPDKVGRDAGDLSGLGRPLGIEATDDIGAIIALRPDCVAYMPLFPDIDHMSQLLRGGINLVTTSEFLTGHAHGPDAIAALDEAGKSGGASVFGSGVNPGWIEVLAAVASGPSRTVDSVRVVEAYHLGMVADEANQDDFGWGRPAGDPGHAEEIIEAVYEFGEAVDLLARLFGVTLDGVRGEVAFAHATKDLQVPGRSIPMGTVAGIEVTWSGTLGGRDVFQLVARWTMTGSLDQPWEVFNGYHVELRGDPNLDLRLGFLPSDEAKTLEDFKAMGNRMTAMPALNAIRTVVAAPPGIVTYADLPPMTAPITSAS